jgi:hypothetical protein
MKAKRRTEITRETHETTIIRFKQNQPAVYCAECGHLTRHLSVGQTVSLFSLSEAEIWSLAEQKRIHSQQTAEGLMLLCGNSLGQI